jgi:hypothetical protein
MSVDFVRIVFPLSFSPVRLSVHRPLYAVERVWPLLIPYAVHSESMCCVMFAEGPELYTVCKWFGLGNGLVFDVLDCVGVRRLVYMNRWLALLTCRM